MKKVLSETPKIEIWQGDCLELMKDIKDQSIDLVLTSPPFNLGKGHHTGNVRHNPYEDNLPEDEYQEQQIKVLNELFRVIREGGSVLYQHKNRIKGGKQITPYEWLLNTDWVVKQELVWFNGSQNFDKIRFYPMTERIYWLAKLSETKLDNIINHHDLFRWKPVGTDADHTRAFPIEMANDLISCFPEAKDILDPFLGSGTTLVAAVNLNRNAIGIEISEKYCQIAEERIMRVINQKKLF